MGEPRGEGPEGARRRTLCPFPRARCGLSRDLEANFWTSKIYIQIMKRDIELLKIQSSGRIVTWFLRLWGFLNCSAK